MGTTDTIKVTLFVDGQKRRTGLIARHNLDAVVLVLETAHEYRDDDITPPTVRIMIQTEKVVVIDAHVNGDVAGTMRLLLPEWLVTVEDKPTAPRPDPEVVRQEREQQLWRLATEMYRNGFGQKPNVHICSVERCPEHTVPADQQMGPRALQPAIAVDKSGKVWNICQEHFQAGRHIAAQWSTWEQAAEQARRTNDVGALGRANEVLTAIDRLGVQIDVFASKKAQEAAKPKGAIAAALTKRAASKPSGSGPAQQAAKPDPDPELTTEKAVEHLAEQLRRTRHGDLLMGNPLEMDATAWKKLSDHMAAQPSAAVGKQGQPQRRAERAVAFLTAVRGEKSTADEEVQSVRFGDEAKPTSDDETVSGAPQGATIN